MPHSLTDLDGLQTSTEDFLGAILEATAQPIWVVDADGVIRFANPAAIAALGYEEAAELLGRQGHETVHHNRPDGTPYPAAECPVLVARTTGKTVARDLDWFFRRDGSMFPVSYVAVPLAMPEGRGAVVAFTDIEDRRRAQYVLREHEATLAAQQASLRRVATLVAGGAASAEVFNAIAREVAQLLDRTLVNVWRYERDGTGTVLGAWSERSHPFQPGTNWPFETPSAAADIGQTKIGRPVRVDDIAKVEGVVADALRGSGMRAAAVAPIVVGGEVWGIIGTASADRAPLPDGIEHRLAEFTELFGTTIANAESRAGLARLAEEQAALRRVATLVAHEAPQPKIFAAIAEEIGRLLGADYIRMVRFEDDRVAVVVASAGATEDVLAGGSRVALEGDNAVSRVFQTRLPARIDEYRTASGPIAHSTRAMGIRGVVVTPILVEGRLWGAMGAGTTQEQPLPPETESRLGQFTELMATAIGNTEARAEVERLANEQAALRRVATLVAKESPPAELFAKVVEELAHVVGEAECLLFRDEGDATASVVASCGAGLSASFPAGTRLPTDGDSVAATVLREGRPHRVDDYANATGTIARRNQEHGARSAVGCPIRARGRIWGVIGAVRYEPEAFPPETETRIAQFADLVATAIANAAARAEVGRLAEEQAALRRVATLVAQGASATSVFDAVAAEMEGLLDADAVALSRYEDDGDVIVVARRGLGTEHMPLGWRVRRDRQNVAAIVRRTERPARIEPYDLAQSALAESGPTGGTRAAVGAPIVVDGRLWGVITAGWVHEPPPADTEERVAQFAQLLDTAIANADSRDQLTASRARLLTEADEARRRVVRDLHDGAQQRQVHTIITLKLAQRAFDDEDANAESLVADALGHAEQGLAELRELAHGILPSALTHGGLQAGVGALVARLDLPVDVDVAAARLPAAIEASAYFIVAEALTNVVKHAHAKHATITARVEDGTLRVQVRDDGIGGARPDGSGLLGLADRLAVLDGRLRIESPADGGTLVAADIPVAD